MISNFGCTSTVLFFSFLIVFSFDTIFVNANGFVTEENNYIKLVTRESGTFVGTKEIIPSTIAPITETGIKLEVNENAPGQLSSIPAEDRFYYAFKGIPYAKIPSGKLRWKAPEAVDIKSGPVRANEFRSVCSQWDFNLERVIGSPDCLYLNVFTPRLHFNIGEQFFPEQSGNISKFDDNRRLFVKHLPVLVYVHNGDFTSKSGNIEGQEHFMKEKVLLVTFNFRIGVFGFLSTGSKALPGNYGLLDQLSTLKWIQKNIYRFGGNPMRVTIFGEVSWLLLSPLAKGLYERAILMSSTSSILTPDAINPNHKEYFDKFVKEVGCPEGTVEEIISDCLQVKPPEELIKAQQKLLKFWKYPKGLTPVIDGDYEEFGVLGPGNLEAALKNLNLTDVHILLGVNKLEGFEVFREFYKRSLRGLELEELESTAKENLLRDLTEILPSMTAESFAGVWNYYFGGVNFTQTSAFGMLYLQLIHLFGDITVYRGYWDMLRSFAAKNKLVSYNYVFDYNADLWKSYLDFEVDSESSIHSEVFPWEEEFSIFNPGINGTNEVSEEIDTLAMVQPMVKLWASFASYGTPKNAISKSKSWTRWHRFTQTNLNNTNYYLIQSNSSHMDVDFRKQENEFWLNALPSISRMAEKAADLEEWPILFWISFAATVLLIIFIAVIIYFIRH